MKLLVGVDGSDSSLAAVRMAGQLASLTRDQVGFYYSTHKLQVSGLQSNRADLLQQAHSALAKAIFDEARAQLPSELRESSHTIADEKDPRVGLLEAADDWSADLVVIGARGLGRIASLLLGSVAASLARTSTRPVLVVRNPDQVRSEGPLRLLLAIDDSPHSSRAAQFTAQLDLPPGSTGRVMTVVEPFYAGELPDWLNAQKRDPEIEAMSQGWLQEYQQTVNERRAHLLATRAQLPAAFGAGEPILAEGNPADEILRAIDGQQIDLVILGAGKSSTLERILLGSTTDHILTYASCSVLLVKN